VVGQVCPNPAVPCVTGGQNGLDANDYGEPLTYAYNFTIDQRLPWDSLLDIAYVGNHGTRLIDGRSSAGVYDTDDMPQWAQLRACPSQHVASI